MENYAIFAFSCSDIAFLAFKRFRNLSISTDIAPYFGNILQHMHSVTSYIRVLLAKLLLDFTNFLFSVSKICNFHSSRYNEHVPGFELCGFPPFYGSPAGLEGYGRQYPHRQLPVLFTGI